MAIQFGRLVSKTGRSGQGCNGGTGIAISAAENPPSILRAIEKGIFAGTGPGEAELGQVGWTLFPLQLPAKLRVTTSSNILENGLHLSKANVNTTIRFRLVRDSWTRI